jgi:hypothetical protein
MADRYIAAGTKFTQMVGSQTPTLIYKTTKYPEIPLSVNDIYVITTDGDRLDLLADQFYDDSTLYWIISSANPNKVNFSSLFINEGTELRIPTNIGGILSQFNALNRS